MTSKRAFSSPYKWLLVLVLLGLAVWWWKGGLDRVIASTSSGREKATLFVAAYAKHAGVHDRVHQTLDANDDRSFGDFGFHYYPERNTLEGRVYIVASDIKNMPDREVQQRQVYAALNDPKIGGMYDRGGGYFHLDEDKQILFLVKDYKLSELSAPAFVEDMDNLVGLSGLWVTNWFGHAANQAHGYEPMPTQRATRENNPYPRQ